MFTLEETEIETDKMACIELCGAVYTAHRQRAMQISIGFCTHFIPICLGFALGIAVAVELCK